MCVLVLVAVAEFAGEVVVNDADQLRAGTLGWGLRWLGVLTRTLYLVNSATREAADRILGAVSRTVWVDEENQLDAVTGTPSPTRARMARMADRVIVISTSWFTHD